MNLQGRETQHAIEHCKLWHTKGCSSIKPDPALDCRTLAYAPLLIAPTHPAKRACAHCKLTNAAHCWSVGSLAWVLHGILKEALATWLFFMLTTHRCGSFSSLSRTQHVRYGLLADKLPTADEPAAGRRHCSGVSAREVDAPGSACAAFSAGEPGIEHEVLSSAATASTRTSSRKAGSNTCKIMQRNRAQQITSIIMNAGISKQQHVHPHGLPGTRLRLLAMYAEREAQ